MSGKIYCIMGRSATGKSTVAKHLEKIGYNVVVSTTTRPIRQGEVEGIDYYYVSEDTFKKKLNSKDFIEYTTYRDWHYGIDKKHMDLVHKDYIAVIEVNGYKQLLKNLGKEKVIPILLHTSAKERLLRAIYREDSEDINVYKEICRRFISDIELFSEIEKRMPALHKIYNVDSEQTAKTIDDYIKYGLLVEVNI